MTPSLVYVLWTDAGHLRDWNTANKVADWAESDHLTVETAGLLVGEHEDWILVALSVNVTGGMVHSPLRIMRANILEMEVFDEYQKTKFDQADSGSTGVGRQESPTGAD